MDEQLVFPMPMAEKLEPYLPPLSYLSSAREALAGATLTATEAEKEKEQANGENNASIGTRGEDENTRSMRLEERRRPWTTLTFATSLDSSLALAPGVRTILSGPKSKAMTHFLRSRHDGILVGVGTAVADDPGLNCRIATAEAGAGSPQQRRSHIRHSPRPIVLDPSLRWDINADSKVLRLAATGAGKAPWIVTSVVSEDIPRDKKELIRGLGGKYVHIPPSSSTSSSMSSPSSSPRTYKWAALLEALWENGIRSLMVEGGGQVINSLLSSPAEADSDGNDGGAEHGDDLKAASHVVDGVIVTIAPTWLGKGGVVVSPDRRAPGLAAARLGDVKWLPMGDDVVLCGRLCC